jgi:hypothetical protein
VIGVVAVFVGHRDLEHPLAHLLPPSVLDLPRIPVVGHQRSEPLRQPEPVVHLPEEKPTAVGGNLGSVKRDVDALVGVEIEADL